MKNRILNNIKLLATLALLLFLTARCANMGSPSGGPKDETPPKLVKSDPAPNALNCTKNKIVLTFDELVIQKDTTKNFIVSPPLLKKPEVKTVEKSIVVNLNNELIENTTYTLYFGNAIVDNNEGNTLENFSFSFSTGEVIDTLQISGFVFNAETLNPVADAIVGLYKNLDDTAFTHDVPLRIGKTLANGYFSIKNIAYGNYKAYALKETNNNYRYDQKGEEIAFLDSVFSPSFYTMQIPDTLWKDSVTVDTIVWADTLIYTPDSLFLFTFKETNPTQRLIKKERNMPGSFLFTFNGHKGEAPTLRFLDIRAEVEREISTTADTVIFWSADSMVLQKDTLRTEITYQTYDSLFNLISRADTIQMIFRSPKETKSKKKETETKTVQEPLKVVVKPDRALIPTYPLLLSFSTPVKQYNKEKIHLYLKSDTSKKELRLTLEPDETLPRRFRISAPLAEESAYILKLDSAAFTDIFGSTNDKKETALTIQKSDAFCNIEFEINTHGKTGILYLLNEKDQPIRKSKIVKSVSKIKFAYLDAGRYYARFLADDNNDEIFTSGNYAKKNQPEGMYYFPKEIATRPNWSYSESWDINETIRIKQQPDVLIKASSSTEKSR